MDQIESSRPSMFQAFKGLVFDYVVRPLLEHMEHYGWSPGRCELGVSWNSLCTPDALWNVRWCMWLRYTIRSLLVETHTHRVCFGIDVSDVHVVDFGDEYRGDEWYETYTRAYQDHVLACLSTLRWPGPGIRHTIEAVKVIPFPEVVEACLMTFPNVREWTLLNVELVRPPALEESFRILSTHPSRPTSVSTDYDTIPRIRLPWNLPSASGADDASDAPVASGAGTSGAEFGLSFDVRSHWCNLRVLDQATRYFSRLRLFRFSLEASPDVAPDDASRAVFVTALGRVKSLHCKGASFTKRDRLINLCGQYFCGEELHVPILALLGFRSIAGDRLHSCRTLVLEFPYQQIYQQPGPDPEEELKELKMFAPLVNVRSLVLRIPVEWHTEFVETMGNLLMTVRKDATGIESLVLQFPNGSRNESIIDYFPLDSTEYETAREGLQECIVQNRFPYLRSADLGHFGVMENDDRLACKRAKIVRWRRAILRSKQ